MAKRPTAAPTERLLTVDQMRKGIATLQRRIVDLEAFDPKSASDDKVTALEKALDEALERVFGRGTSDFSRYVTAAHLDNGPISFGGIYGSGERDTVRFLTEGKTQSLAILKQAIRSLEERIDEAEPEAPKVSEALLDSDRVFIAHGRDGGIKHEVARFIDVLGLKAVILDEQTNQGMTLIEKFEAHSSVGFAVVLLTPDDVGSLAGGVLQPRARQNVILELGFFAGKLGRKKVAAVVRGTDLELPSDINGLVWMRYEEDWKLRLARVARDNQGETQRQSG